MDTEKKRLPAFCYPSYYSSTPDLDDSRSEEGALSGAVPREIPGINLNEPRQRELLESFRAYYGELPFPEHKSDGRRFFFENPMYPYSDAIMLYSMMRHFKPKRIVEVGSGHSSCAMLDVNELFLNGGVQFTFIEPDPARLFSHITESDRNRVQVLRKNVQDVGMGVFSELSAGDFLFIDSTHVSKMGSDVNYLFFQVLPALAPGVYVHFHDVYHPFEYPEWVSERRTWSEAYLLRAFLQFNQAFEIVLFSDLMHRVYPDFFAREMPLCLKNPGASIWIRRVPAPSPSAIR